MYKNRLLQPTIIYFLGMPGSGKTYVSRQLSELLGAAHISSDRLRYELFAEPRFDKGEHMVITRLMDYMTEEFLGIGRSVIYDISVSRQQDRRELRELARKYNAKELLVWIQTDVESGWNRAKARDKRKADDKYSLPLDRSVFDQYVRLMQNPQHEQYVVLSGKHVFDTQKAAILRRLTEMSVLDVGSFVNSRAKPELVNLVSRAHAQVQAQQGRVDPTRRNIPLR